MDKEHLCGCGEESHDCGCGEENNTCGGDHGSGCGSCDGTRSQPNEEVKVLHLTMEDGSEIDCTELGRFTIEDRDYIALLSFEDEVFLYKYKDIGEKEMDLINIEDDEEFEIASEKFYEIYG